MRVSSIRLIFINLLKVIYENNNLEAIDIEKH
jgi:hypothetical protein